MNKVLEQNFDSYAEVFGRGFCEDPLLCFLFRGSDYDKTRRFFRFILKNANLNNQKILAQNMGQNVACISCLDTPESTIQAHYIRTYGNMIALMMKFCCDVGLRAFGYINQYMRITTGFRPDANHHYLVCIVTDPRYQGQGLAKKTLNELHELVDNHPTSIGIGLDTENKKNVTLYEQFGYRLVGEEKLGDIVIYSMFRDKRNK